MKKIFCSKLLIVVAFSLSALNIEKFETYAKKICKTQKIEVDSIKGKKIATFLAQDGTRSFFIISSDFSEAKGYNGVTTVGIVLDENFEIVNVQIIESEDTKMFVRRVNRKSFLKRFLGWNGKDEIKLVTGATVTSNAVVKSVSETLGKAKEILGSLIAEKNE